MPAEKNKCGNVPANYKHADSYTNNGRPKRVHAAQVFRSQEKGVGAKSVHECTVDSAKENEPESKQHLVFPEMQEQ